MKLNCAVADCNRPCLARGFCKSHYERQRTGREVLAPLAPKVHLVVDGRKRCSKCHRSLPIDSFTKSGRMKCGYSGRCRECQRALVRKFKFGVTQDRYDAMLAEQAGVCAVCERVETDLSRSRRPKPLSVDHCHETGRVRGLLCSRCNIAIGLVGDDPNLLRKLIGYLSAHGTSSGGSPRE